MKTVNEGQLYESIKLKIVQYFEQTRKTKKANLLLVVKALIFLCLIVGGYGLMITLDTKDYFFFFCYYLLFTLGSILFVVTVGHDASHQSLFKRRSANKIVGYSWNILGISKHLWEMKHHHSHHIYTNIPHKDFDIAESPLIRLNPNYNYRPYYKYQYLYAPALYLLFGVFVIYVRDFIFYYKTLYGQPGTRFGRYFLINLLITKLGYIFISIVIPAILLPFEWWTVLATNLGCLGIGGSFLLLVLIVPHINETAAINESSTSIKNQNDWTLHQIRCTIDSSADSRLLSWLTGGLNTHLIHHLFPDICHVHYIDLTRLVRQELNERGIRYQEKPIAISIIDHFRFLKKMGIRPSNS